MARLGQFNNNDDDDDSVLVVVVVLVLVGGGDENDVMMNGGTGRHGTDRVNVSMDRTRIDPNKCHHGWGWQQAKPRERTERIPSTVSSYHIHILPRNRIGTRKPLHRPFSVSRACDSLSVTAPLPSVSVREQTNPRSPRALSVSHHHHHHHHHEKANHQSHGALNATLLVSRVVTLCSNHSHSHNDVTTR